jgi:hypothetical protein
LDEAHLILGRIIVGAMLRNLTLPHFAGQRNGCT